MTTTPTPDKKNKRPLWQRIVLVRFFVKHPKWATLYALLLMIAMFIAGGVVATYYALAPVSQDKITAEITTAQLKQRKAEELAAESDKALKVATVQASEADAKARALDEQLKAQQGLAQKQADDNKKLAAENLAYNAQVNQAWAAWKELDVAQKVVAATAPPPAPAPDVAFLRQQQQATAQPGVRPPVPQSVPVVRGGIVPRPTVTQRQQGGGVGQTRSGGPTNSADPNSYAARVLAAINSHQPVTFRPVSPRNPVAIVFLKGDAPENGVPYAELQQLQPGLNLGR